MIIVILLENSTPTMRDLNRYVTKKYAAYWYDIGLELGLEVDFLDVIEKDFPQQCAICFRKVLNDWLKTTTPTWNELEVALTNVRRQQLGLPPVDDEDGEYTSPIKSLLMHTCASVNTIYHPVNAIPIMATTNCRY